MNSTAGGLGIERDARSGIIPKGQKGEGGSLLAGAVAVLARSWKGHTHLGQREFLGTYIPTVEPR